MTLEEAIHLVRACVDQMNARYTKTVFNEWALLSIDEKAGHILSYSGPRKDDFQKNFSSDLDALRAGLLDPKYGVGDFEFARHATGIKFEAFMVIGPGLYLVCNHTRASMDDIATDSHWLGAQVPFVASRVVVLLGHRSIELSLRRHQRCGQRTKVRTHDPDDVVRTAV